jgi:hypothetical protein
MGETEGGVNWECTKMPRPTIHMNLILLKLLN